MSPGKIAGQAFQVAARFLPTLFAKPANTEHEMWAQQQLRQWYSSGTRTIVREAKTPAIFERVMDEVPGFIMRDEGHTEVEAGSATVYMTYPFLHKDRPRVLDNKKVRLL